MIKLQEYTPDVYYKESRDFQFIGRLFDLILNSVKTDADLIYNIPISDNSNDKLLELMALTLGFKAKHQYSTIHLRAICKVFPLILRNKGTINAVIIACNALFTADGLEQIIDYSFSEDNTKLNLYIPQDFTDVVLLNDLLTYILPAGMSCNIIKEFRVPEKPKTELNVSDIFRIYDAGEQSSLSNKTIVYDNNVLAKIPQISTDPKDRINGIVNVNDVVRGLVQDNVGFIMNGAVYKPNKE